MTEEEWLSGDVRAIEAMVDCAEDHGSERKLRLFAVQCCYRIGQVMDDERSRAAVAAAESYADGRCSATHLAARLREAAAVFQALDVIRTSRLRASEPEWQDNLTRSTAAAAASCAANPRMGRTAAERTSGLSAAGSAAHHARNVAAWIGSASAARAMQEGQIRLLRDIFGNPFRPVTFSPEWRTDTAVVLARTMYEARDFGAMPILADALQDAECEDDDILGHCRDTHQVHVRGCWCVDLVLGKE